MPTRQSSNTQPTRRSARLAGNGVSATRPTTSGSATRTASHHQPHIQNHKPPTSKFKPLQEEHTEQEELNLVTEPMNVSSQTEQLHTHSLPNQLPLISIPNCLPPIATWANCKTNAPNKTTMSSTQLTYTNWEMVRLG